MELEFLLKTEFDKRNQNWEKDFILKIFDSNIYYESEIPQYGPDGWPYFLVNTIKNGQSENGGKILHWLSEKGIGLVVNSNHTPVDLMLTYGMIWSLREFGFNTQLKEDSIEIVEDFELEKNTSIKSGAPSLKYLPLYVRKILKQFFLDQGILNPRILVLSKDLKNYDLCFSSESLDNPKKETHLEIAKTIAWFLPTHYNIVITSEKSLPHFYPL